MARSLSSMNRDQKADAIRRRVKSGTLGLGFWASVDALKNHRKVVKVQQRLTDEPVQFETSLLPREEAENLLQMAQKTQQAAGIPENWILDRR